MLHSTLRRLLVCALLFTTASQSKSQTYDTTQIQGFLQHLMQSHNKSQISTGFLEEYGLPAVGMASFDGVSTNTANWSEPNLWRLLYFQLYTSFTGTTNPLPTIQSVNTTINSNLSSSAPTPILQLIYKKAPITVMRIYTKLRLEQSVASQYLAILRSACAVKIKHKGKQLYIYGCCLNELHPNACKRC
jgi:hypothetical protein